MLNMKFQIYIVAAIFLYYIVRTLQKLFLWRLCLNLFRQNLFLIVTFTTHGNIFENSIQACFSYKGNDATSSFASQRYDLKSFSNDDLAHDINL